MKEPTDLVSFTVRFESWVKDLLEESAKRSRRSLNKEINMRIEASLDYQDILLVPRKPGGRPEPTFGNRRLR